MCPIHICGIPADRILSRGYSIDPSLLAGTTAISEFVFVLATIFIATNIAFACISIAAIFIFAIAIIEFARISITFIEFAESIITTIVISIIIIANSKIADTVFTKIDIKQNQKAI